LREFLKIVQPRRVVPCVNAISADEIAPFLFCEKENDSGIESFIKNFEIPKSVRVFMRIQNEFEASPLRAQGPNRHVAAGLTVRIFPPPANEFEFQTPTSILEKNLEKTEKNSEEKNLEEKEKIENSAKRSRRSLRFGEEKEKEAQNEIEVN
jgi:hypothetical protein